MFTKFRHIALLSTAAFALQGCASYTSGDTVATVAPAAQQVDLAAIMAKPEGASGPALWKVADEDTTIYLFGTVHLLPETKEWYNGPIATALGGATEIVTEIPIGAMSDPATQQAMMMKALLPPDQNLRDMLSDEDRTAYEAAMGKLDLPPAAFDRFKPWLAGMTLGVLPLMKAGWDPTKGGEQVVDSNAPEGATRSSLETAEQQIEFFSSMSPEAQIAFLVSTVEGAEIYMETMEAVVAEWEEGDPVELAELLNKSFTDPALADTLLYNRNAHWAVWLDDRMDQPGQVFVAVGAGHLAGQKSVQDYLAQRGFTVTRVQ